MDGVLARLEGRIKLPENKKEEVTEATNTETTTSSTQTVGLLVALGLAFGALTVGYFLRR